MGVLDRWDPKPAPRISGSTGDRKDDLTLMKSGLIGESSTVGGVSVWRPDQSSAWIPQAYITGNQSSVPKVAGATPGKIVVPTESGQWVAVDAPSQTRYAAYWNPNEGRFETEDTQEGFWEKNTAPIAKAAIATGIGFMTGGAATPALQGALGSTAGSVAGSAVGGAAQGASSAGMTKGGDVGKGALVGALSGASSGVGNAIGGTTGAAVGGALGGATGAAAAGGTSSDIGQAALTGAATGALRSEIGQLGKEYDLNKGITGALQGSVKGLLSGNEDQALHGAITGGATGLGGELGGKTGSMIGGMLAKNYIAGEQQDAMRQKYQQYAQQRQQQNPMYAKYQQYLKQKQGGGMMTGTTQAGNSPLSRFNPQQLQQLYARYSAQKRA